MSQLGLIAAPPSSLRPPLARAASAEQVHPPPGRASAPRADATEDAPPTRDLVEDAGYDDGPGCGVASYSLKTRVQFLGDLRRAGFWVYLERHFGWRPHRWMVSVHLELQDEERTTWREYTILETQEDAAREAADMALVARRLLEAHLRGETVETPGQRRQQAAEARADADEAYRNAVQRADDQRAVFEALEDSDPARWTARSHWSAALEAMTQLRKRALAEFSAAHVWKEFA